MPSFALWTVCVFGLALTASLVANPITLPLVKELNPCTPYEFTCKSGQCVSQYNVCDAFDDCSDGDDENITMCLAKPCHPDYPYKCTHNGICIPLSWLCDGHNDCGDNSDEVLMTCVKLLHKEGIIIVDKNNPNALQPSIDGDDNKENGDDDDNDLKNGVEKNNDKYNNNNNNDKINDDDDDQSNDEEDGDDDITKMFNVGDENNNNN